MANIWDQKAKKGMTKGAARTHLNAAKKAMKNVEHAIRHGQVGTAKDAVREAIMELSIIEGADIHWTTTCPRVVEGGQVCGKPASLLSRLKLCDAHDGDRGMVGREG